MVMAKKRVKAGTSKAAAAERRAKFVEAYIANCGNATQAAIVAGFAEHSARVTGAQLLADPNISAEVERRRAEVIVKAQEKTELSKTWVLERLRVVAERCLQSEPVVDRKGEPVLAEKPDGGLALAY